MAIEVQIDKNRRAAQGRAVELTILKDGQPVFSERLAFPAGLSRQEVQDRIGRLALARTENNDKREPDWDLAPGRRLLARNMLKSKLAELPDEPQSPAPGGE